MDKDYFSNGEIPPLDYFLNTNLENSNLELQELIGKLGTDCNNNNNDSTMTSSCYTNPRLLLGFGNRSFNSRKTSQDGLNNSTDQTQGLTRNLPRVSSQNGLNNSAGRSLSRVSSQDGRNNGTGNKMMGLSRNLPRVSSSPCFNENKNSARPQMETKLELDRNPNSNEDCSASEINGRKRKANSSGKGKKIAKMEENEKITEPLKDYIHVRARRGEATDSHSLAERVRREKISQRMKFLQDLVPGCNKVTGKALMLDEIINYVQSLQRQVEFLSMKLATVNPRLDFHIDNLLPKDIYQQNGCLPQLVLPLDGFGENHSQIPTICEDELQSIVQMGFNNNLNQDMTLHSQNFHVTDSTSQMKIDM